MKPLLVINDDRCVPGTVDHLQRLGYDCVRVEGLDTPAVQTVPTKEDRRFTAAVAAMQGMIAGSNNHWASWDRHGFTPNVVSYAVKLADTLLAELAK